MQDEMWNTFKMVSAIATAIFLNVDMMWENAVFVTKNAKSSNWEMELAIVLETPTSATWTMEIVACAVPIYDLEVEVKQLLLDMNYSILVYSVFQLFRHLS